MASLFVDFSCFASQRSTVVAFVVVATLTNVANPAQTFLIHRLELYFENQLICGVFKVAHLITSQYYFVLFIFVNIFLTYE